MRYWQFQTPLSSSCGCSQSAGIGGIGLFAGQSFGTPGGRTVVVGAAVVAGADVVGAEVVGA